MARYNVSFTRKFTAVINSEVAQAIYSLGRMSACAGIKGNPEAAKKARYNHHGAPATHVPARRFVYDATRNIDGHNFGTEISRIIKQQIRSPKPAMYSFDPNAYAGRSEFSGEIEYGKRTHTAAAPFGERDGEQRTPRRILGRIANQMAANQRNAIKERAYSDGASNGNDPHHNTPRVAKHKGFDWPMVDTGETLSAIQGWVE